MLRSTPVGWFVRYVVYFLLVLAATGASSSPQAFPTPMTLQRWQDRLQQELTFRRGRLPKGRVSGTPAATLLQRAYEQKANLQHKQVSAYAVSSSEDETPWTSLGPAPLLSNASGSLGEQ